MTTLREFMAARRAEIQSQIKALRLEMAEIDAAFSALSLEGQAKPARERGSSGTGKKTLKELAIEAIRSRHEGMEAAEILRWIKDMAGKDVPRESLSPQLSRLGQDGTLMREGMVWKLGPKAVFAGDPASPVVLYQTAPTSEEEGAE